MSKCKLPQTLKSHIRSVTLILFVIHIKVEHDLFVKEVSVAPQQTMKTDDSFDFGNNMFGSGFE